MKRVSLTMLSLLLCVLLGACTSERPKENQGQLEEQSVGINSERSMELLLSRDTYYFGKAEQLDYCVLSHNNQSCNLSSIPVLEYLSDGQWTAVEAKEDAPYGAARTIEGKYEGNVPLDMFSDLQPGSYRLGFQQETQQGEPLEMLYSQSFTLVDRPADMKVVSAKASGVKILLCNYSGEEYAYCSDYVLEYDDGAQWQCLKPVQENTIQINTDFVIQEGQCVGMEIDWQVIYGSLPEGNYRLTKCLEGTQTEQLLAVQTEFEVHSS